MNSLEAIHELEELASYSARLGKDSAHIQGPGGNTSVKRNGTMLVKKSGSWLSDALAQNVFVSVNLTQTLNQLHSSDNPIIFMGTESDKYVDGRPSIETWVHACINKKFVIHTHSVAVIAAAIREDAEQFLSERLAGFDWAFVPYVKPGLNLAIEIVALNGRRTADLLVLQNHGLIICGDTIEICDTLLSAVNQRLSATPPFDSQFLQELVKNICKFEGYLFRDKPNAIALALSERDCAVACAGSLYPDHAVFLHNEVRTVSEREFNPTDPSFVHKKMIIVPGVGVYTKTDITLSEMAMVDCICDVLALVPEAVRLKFLTDNEVTDLLTWDAEKERQHANKEK